MAASKRQAVSGARNVSVLSRMVFTGAVDSRLEKEGTADRNELMEVLYRRSDKFGEGGIVQKEKSLKQEPRCFLAMECLPLLLTGDLLAHFSL